MYLCRAATLSTFVLGAAWAQDQPLKIGYIDANRVVSEAPQGARALEDLQEEFAEREQELRKLQIELLDSQDKLEDPDLSISDAREIENQVRQLQRELDRGTTELNEDFNYRRNQELEQLQSTISDLILRIAREQEFDLIVQSPVVWASERIDITDNVLAELQQMFSQ